ncbi:MAG: hypothetical protein GTO24_10025 [candidate division Zixibacteria bacterium]|nr:hypothetical protein [candidate division Zixibacteria bacterium]
MPRKAALALVLGTLLFSPAQAGDYLSPMEAQAVAQELVDRIVSYVSANPEKAADLPELSGARITDPMLVHRYPDLKPCYYVVPAVGPGGEITCLIGISADKKDWQWFRRAQLEAFPRVRKEQALQVCQGIAGNLAIPEPKVVDMPNKKMYWLCRTNDADLNEIFVNIEDPTEVHTDLDADISDLTTGVGPIRIPAQHPESPVQRAPDRSPSYPDAYNIEDVPFYYQETSWYCGEASLEMVFDYWGPDISQTDIGDAANDIPGVGTYLDDLRRASHFSYISTAIQNPLLQGYNERDYGYSSCEVCWSDAEHYPTRYDDLKELISNDYPIIVCTWYSSSHSVGHYRVVKGYDDNLDYFLVHDPWYGGGYSGPDVHFNQTFFVDDLWVYADRWGLLSVPWQIAYYVPPYVFAGGDTLRIEVSFTYVAPHPFEDQFNADIHAETNVPQGYVYYPPTIPDIDFNSQYSGFSADTCWEYICLWPKPEPDTFRIEVSGHVSSGSISYPSYEDVMGGVFEEIVYAVHFLCGDVNLSEWVDASDIVYLINYLFRGGDPPLVPEMADVNVDSVINASDIVYLLNYLFRDGPDPCE